MSFFLFFLFILNFKLLFFNLPKQGIPEICSLYKNLFIAGVIAITEITSQEIALASFLSAKVYF